MDKYDHLELARIIGQPVDPKKPYSKLIDLVCEVDGADPEDHVYTFDVLEDTDIVYVITADGKITATSVTIDTPNLLSFVDIASPEYYIKLTDLAKAKENVFARKKRTINRAMNAYENWKVISLIDTAATGRSNTDTLDSGASTFNFSNAIEMIDQIIDYSDDYILIAGSGIDKDIKLLDWTDNKYQSTLEAFRDLGIQVIRVKGTVTKDGTPTAMLASDIAYLVGRQTEEPSRPILWVRKNMDIVKRLGGVIQELGDVAQRLVFVSPNPVHVGANHYLAVGITGFGEYGAVCTNPYACAKFDKTP